MQTILLSAIDFDGYNNKKVGLIMKKTIFTIATLALLTGCGNSAANGAAATDTTATDTAATDTTATDTTATDTTATDTTTTDTQVIGVDDDVVEQQIVTDLKSLAITTAIETKAQLDAYLQQIANELSGQTLSASYKENLLDVVEETVDNYFEITPVPADGLGDDDYGDYFERNQLNNQDTSDYIEITLPSLLK